MTASELEDRMLALIRAAGLPLPRVNEPVGPYRGDFVWPEHRLIVETDGWQTHGTRLAFEADRTRDADLTRAGWTVVRFTWRQVRDAPEHVAATIAAVLRRRGRER
jgi:very-short-patch-repair endonuclease